MRKLFICLLFLQIFYLSAGAVSAKSAVVIDADTGAVLFAQNENEVLSMASTTKIMTALIAIENGNLEREYSVKKEYTLVEGSSMYLKENEKISILDTLYGLMLMSGNDAALAIAGECGGFDAFVDKMNNKAIELGLENTHFENPNGLDAETHHTTALELAKLTAYAMQNPTFAQIVSTETYTSGTRTMTNHNKLLKIYENCIGVKTGYTKKSGRCLVSAAEQNSRTLIAVTLNDPDDWNDHISMLNNAFELYKPTVIQKSGNIIGEVNCQGGTENNIKLSGSSDITLWLTDEEKNNLSFTISGRPFVYAPAHVGQIYGTINYTLNDKVLATDDLVFSSKADMQQPSLSLIQKIIQKFLSIF